jgi:hypothetical protein
VTGVIAGNISDEATPRLGNIFAEAMRGIEQADTPISITVDHGTEFISEALEEWD